MKTPNLLKSAAIALAAIFTAGSGVAGSMEPPAVEAMPTVSAPAAPAADWSGFYVGALGGYQQGKLTVFPGLPGPTFNAKATTYGGFAGYAFQQGNLVYGAELDAQMGKGRIFGLNFNVDYLVDARARVGYVFDNVLVYGTGGYSATQFTRGGASLALSGFNVGAGIELAVTDQFFVGGEYIYRDLTGKNFGVPWGYKSHAVQIRAGWRF